MWIRDAVSSPWRRVNPLDNPNANYTNLPPNEPDTWNPELNDVVLHGISEPAGTNSGIVATGTGVVNGFQGNHTRIHFLNHPGQASTNGLPYDANTGKIVVFGSIGSILHERDSRVTNAPAAIGTGLGIDAARFSINGQEKYRVKFDEILETELTRTTDFYATTFDAPMAFGNNDYLKMRRITGETARRPHKLINGVQSNGVWATRAKNTTADVFATTPTEIANCPDEAKYQDGKHTLNFTVSDAANNSDNKNIETIVDNFQPYVKSLVVKQQDGTVIYEGKWTCNGSCISFSETKKDYNSANNCTVIVTTSEPMTGTVILLNGTTAKSTSAVGAVTTFLNTDLVAGPITIKSGGAAPNFTFKDLADNQLLNLAPKKGQCVTVPTRTGATTFSNPNNIISNGEENSFSLHTSCPLTVALTTKNPCKGKNNGKATLSVTSATKLQSILE